MPCIKDIKYLYDIGALHKLPASIRKAEKRTGFPQNTGNRCKYVLRQYRTNRQESLARDFSSEKGGKPQEYFVYFKVLLTHFWRKRSVRIRRCICAVLPLFFCKQRGGEIALAGVREDYHNALALVFGTVCTWVAAHRAAPEEMPTKMPSVRAISRPTWKASSFFTAMTSS